MGQCKNCKKDIQEYTGRRPKVYCSAACRQRFFQTKNKTKAAKKKEKAAEVTVAFSGNLNLGENEFMGVPIPEGLTGIQLAVWKNNIKLGKNKK